MRKIVLLLVLFGFVGFSIDSCFAGQSTFRCGSKLVNLGDRAAEVKLKCGPPSSVDAVGGGGAKRASESWYYNCGDGSFNSILTFSAGVLVQIDVLDSRGSGLPDWVRNNVPQ